MDKAPDAFRTISEVADDLDIPQHVLRFWETRFTQIKPMKRSGGRRYYRPDDVDLLRGIRHLLYGEGYTIRGVQRILKEQGIRSVQGIASGGAIPAAGVADRDAGRESDLETEIETAGEDDEEIGMEAPAPAVRAPSVTGAKIPPVLLVEPDTLRSATGKMGAAERGRLQDALRELLSCRTMLDDALRRPGSP